MGRPHGKYFLSNGFPWQPCEKPDINTVGEHHYSTWEQEGQLNRVIYPTQTLMLLWLAHVIRNTDNTGLTNAYVFQKNFGN